MLTALERRWRHLFATAVYTGMSKGELLALRKLDVDLKTGTIRVGRSLGSDTTKGNREELLPVAVGLVPYLREALTASPRRIRASPCPPRTSPLRLLLVCCWRSGPRKDERRGPEDFS